MKARITFLALESFILGLFLDFGELTNGSQIFPFARWGSGARGPLERIQSLRVSELGIHPVQFLPASWQ